MGGRLIPAKAQVVKSAERFTLRDNLFGQTLDSEVLIESEAASLTVDIPAIALLGFITNLRGPSRFILPARPALPAVAISSLPSIFDCVCPPVSAPLLRLCPQAQPQIDKLISTQGH